MAHGKIAVINNDGNSNIYLLIQQIFINPLPGFRVSSRPRITEVLDKDIAFTELTF